MGQTLSVFEEDWLARARARGADSCWADDVLEALNGAGGVYLASLQLWFSKFPLSNKHKRALKAHLESFHNEDHLGAVNELAWWVFMDRAGLKATPVPVSTGSRPDFYVEAPTEFFAEVSTLNISEKEKKKFAAGDAIELDHAETVRRVLLKVSDEKRSQMSYAANHHKPCALVLFDYTTWSGFATQFFRVLADFLLSKGRGFREMPFDLAALVYVERKVIDGRIAISQGRSAVYYNPYAKYELHVGTFPELNQFSCQMVTVEPKFESHWLWL
jgi:hypothetical protein